MTAHPIQPLETDENGVLRFKRNAIVCFLLDNGPHDMNSIGQGNFTREDREQFAQLIGYSHSGAHDLGYVSSEVLRVSEALANNPLLKEKDERIEYLRDRITDLQASLREGIAELYGLHVDDLEVRAP